MQTQKWEGKKLFSKFSKNLTQSELIYWDKNGDFLENTTHPLKKNLEYVEKNSIVGRKLSNVV